MVVFCLLHTFYSNCIILFLFQGTASVVLAGLMASLNLVGGSLAEHTFLFLGAGEVHLSLILQTLSSFCTLNCDLSFATRSIVYCRTEMGFCLKLLCVPCSKILAITQELLVFLLI